MILGFQYTLNSVSIYFDLLYEASTFFQARFFFSLLKIYSKETFMV